MVNMVTLTVARRDARRHVPGFVVAVSAFKHVVVSQMLQQRFFGGIPEEGREASKKSVNSGDGGDVVVMVVIVVIVVIVIVVTINVK